MEKYRMNPGEQELELATIVLPHDPGVHACQIDIDPPICICLLGDFRVLKAGRTIDLHSSKAAILLAYLALRPGRHIPREALLNVLWPDSDSALAGQSLNTLLCSLRKSLGDVIRTMMNGDVWYTLDVEAGVSVDVHWFDKFANMGERQARTGNAITAADLYNQAICLYRGDLCVDHDLPAVLERERLRVRYLTLLTYLGNHAFTEGNYAACQDYMLRLLASDPCCEEAHRSLMLCYIRQGERIHALRQYRLCEQLLRAEFDALPEPATTALFNQLRLHPGNV